MRPARAGRRPRRAWPALLALALGAAAIAGAPPARAAEEPPPETRLARSLKAGTFAASLRYRFERVDDAAPRYAGDALASTLRTTLSFRSAAFHDFAAFLEVEDVSDLGLGDRHANGAAGERFNGVTDRPVVADPEGTGLNAALLAYTGLPGTVMTLGRQEIARADERHLGPVGWRQNRQSFDAFRVVQTSMPRTTFDYAYIANVSRVTGDNLGMRSHVLDVAIDAGPAGTVAPYYHRLDYDDADADALSSATVGARLTGTIAAGGRWSFPYHLEAARQRDAGGNPAGFDAGYRRLEARARRGNGWVGAGWELLGAARGGGAFTTPLATLHKFNGWADRFGATPPGGLEDLYIMGGWSRRGLSVNGTLHRFAADAGGGRYGTEIDAGVSYRARWGQLFTAEAARYDADGFATDTTKLWLYTTYAF